MRMMLGAFAISAGLYLFIVILAYSFQRSLLYFPDQSFLDGADYSAVNLELVNFGTPASDNFTSSLWRPPIDPQKPVLLHLHGNAGSTTTRIPIYEMMSADGAGVLAVGYPGYGGGTGSPTEEGLTKAAQANYDWLIERGYKPHQIVIVGQSLGTGIATKLAAGNDAAGLILEAAYTGMDDIAQRQFPFLPAKWLIKDRYRSLDRIDQIDMPLVWIHGTQDEIIPFAMGQELFDAAREPKRAYPIKGGGHNDLWQLGIGSIVREAAARMVEGQFDASASNGNSR